MPLLLLAMVMLLLLPVMVMPLLLVGLPAAVLELLPPAPPVPLMAELMLEPLVWLAPVDADLLLELLPPAPPLPLSPGPLLPLGVSVPSVQLAASAPMAIQRPSVKQGA